VRGRSDRELIEALFPDERIRYQRLQVDGVEPTPSPDVEQLNRNADEPEQYEDDQHLLEPAAAIADRMGNCC
jgi:hypothetical protein